MMHFAAGKLSGSEIQKNKLYHLQPGQCFDLTEEHDNTEDDTISCQVYMGGEDEAVFGREYRSPDIVEKGAKRADLLCIMISENQKKTTTYIYEVKHKITHPDRVMEAVPQLIASIRQKNGMLYQADLDNYKEETYVGLITTEIQREPIGIY